MPVIFQTTISKVSALWGRSFIRATDGTMRPLKLGETVVRGDVILTEQDAIVQLSTDAGAHALAPADLPRDTHARMPNGADLSRVIAAVERGDAGASPAVGIQAGDGGDLQPGLRVERVVEGTAPDGIRSTPIEHALPTTPRQDGDVEALPRLSVDDVQVNEAAGTVSFTVRLGTASRQLVSVDFNLVPDSAIAVADFAANGGTLGFAPGVTALTITVAIVSDALFEGSEHFLVNLSNPTHASVADGVGIGTIIDDDRAPRVTAVVPGAPGTADDAVPEGNALVYTVTLSSDAGTPISYPFVLGGGTASANDIGAPVFSHGVTLNPDGTVTVPAGVTQFTVTIPTTPDSTDEPDETVDLTIDGVPAAGTITDDDAAPSLSIDDLRVNEAASTISFTVTLSGASGLPVSVAYISAGGSATSGADFSPVAGTLNFAPGVIAQTVTVAIANDTLHELEENFSLVLSTAVNASIADATGIATIVDNDTVPTIAAIEPGAPGASDDGVPEGSTLVFGVTLSHPSVLPVSYPYAVGGGTATAGDIGAPSFSNGVTLNPNGTITVPAGVTAFTITVPSTPDTVDEPTETVPLSVGGVGGTGSIVDDDAPPSLSTADVTVDETAGTATFTVTLDAASEQTVSIDYASSSGSAIAGIDFAAVAGSLSFAPGVVSQSLTVAITDDTVFESAETFTITLSAPVNAVIADDSAVGRILDNDTPPALDLDGDDSAGIVGTGYTTTFTEDGAPVSIGDIDLRVGDVDSTTVQGATITLDNAQAGDVLAVGALPPGITAVVTGTQITLAGTASLAAYEAAIRAITFNHVGDDPDSTTRQVSVVLTDGVNSSNVAVATITANPVNDTPVATDDIVSTPINTPVNGIPVLPNDTDPDGDPLTVTTAAPVDPAQGTVTVNPDGTLNFTPATNVTGPVVITYTVSDGQGGTSTATMTVNVGANAAPTGADSVHTMAEDASYTVQTADFGFADGDAGQTFAGVRIDTLPNAGTLLLNGVAVAAGALIPVADIAAGQLVFVPVADANGSPYASFTFSVQDSAGAFDAEPNSLTVHVTRVADTAVIGGLANGATVEDTTLTTGGTLTITDVDAGESTFQAQTNVAGAYGTFSIDTAGVWTYTLDNATPDVQALGAGQPLPNEVFTVQSLDGTTSQVTVTITGSDDAPVISSDVGAVTEDTVPSTTGTLTATDVDNPSLAFVPGTFSGSHGSLVLQPDGQWTYTLDQRAEPLVEGQVVTEPFTVRLTDGSSTIVTLTVAGTNDAPLAIDDFVSTPINTPLSNIPVLPNDTDPDGDPLTVTTAAPANPAQGTVTVNPDGTLNFTPATNVTGPVVITYTITDPQGDSSTATVIVTVGANTAPTGADSVHTIAEDSSYTVQLADFGYADGDAGQTFANVRIDTLPAAGSLQLDGVAVAAGALIPVPAIAAGQLVFVPVADANGSPYAGVTFSVQDSAGAFDAAPNALTIHVTPVNDAPVSATDAGGTLEDTPITGNVLTNDSDVDGPTLRVSEFAIGGTAYPAGGTATLPGVGTLVIQPDGSYTFTPVANYNGPVPIATYTATDGTVTSNSTLTLTVTPVNDPPVANDDTVTTPINTPVNNIAVLPNDTDVDGNPLTVTGAVLTNPTQGTVTVNPDGTLNFTPATDATGPVVIAYTVSDGQGGTGTATVTVVVGDNTPPNGADGAHTIDEDTSYTVTTGDFGYADADVGQAFAFVRIDTLPTAGQLLLNGVAVAAGALIPIAAIAAGQLVFTPLADASTSPYASFTFSVQDSAGAFDAAPNTLTITVTPTGDIADDTVTTSEDTPVNIAVLGNDSFENAGHTVTAVDGTPAVVGTPIAVANGSVTLLADGTLNFTPAANYNGPASFTYTVTSGGVTETAAVNITVAAVNDPTLVTAGTSGSGPEDTVLTGTLVASDLDGLADGTVYTVSGSPTTGTATIDPATGAWNYTPVADWNGADSFTVTITDDAGNTTTQLISVSVSPVVDIVTDVLATTEDTPISANVIIGTNGTSADSFEGTPVLSAVTQGTNGVVTFDAAGSVTYTPNVNFNGADTFTYTVTSPAGTTETTTVTVNVGAADDPTLVTSGTSGSGQEDTVVTGTLVATDTDGLADGTAFTFSGTPTNGTASINPATGAWTYTPTADWNGADSFTVTITDDVGNTTTQLVSVNVTPVVDIANNSVTTNEDTLVNIAVLGNDSFENAGRTVTAIDGTPVVVGTPIAVANGSVTLLADGTLNFTPAANYNGPASFTYAVTSGGVTETAAVNITVAAVNDPTLVTAGTSGSGPEDTVVTANLVATDSDGLADGSVYTVSGTPTNGTATIDPATGAWNYMPVADWNGADSFTVTITDDAGNTTTQLVSVNVSPVVDIANNGVTTNEDTLVNIAALGNDSFENAGRTITAINGTTVVVGTPLAVVNGSVTLKADGAIDFTPIANFNGPVSFTYTVTSGGVTETATVNVTVNPANDPTLVTVGTSGSGNEDTIVTGALVASDLDGLTDGSIYTVSGTPTNGTASIDPATGAWNYIPFADWNGADSFTVTITDDAGNTTTQLVSVNVNPVVDIVADVLTTTEDTPISANVLTGTNGASVDSFEGAPVLSSVTQGTNGVVTFDAAGNVTYTPNANFNGADPFTYTVTSPAGITETTTVTVNVGAVNDPTVVTAGTAGSGSEDTAVTGTLVATDSDGLADGSVYTVSGTPTNGTATIDPANGAWYYTPLADWNGADSFTVTITDDAGNTTTQLVNVNVSPVVDIANDSVTTNEDTLVNVNALGNDSFENAGSTITAINGTAVVVGTPLAVANGTVTLKADGTLDFAPTANYNGATGFTYTVTSGGATETATVNVTVTAVDDVPVNTVPGAQSTTEDTAEVFSSANGNAITVADVDGGTLTTTLSIANGTLALGSTAGVTVSGNGTGTVTITGTAAAINAALNSTSYTPTADYNGSATLTMVTSDVSLTDTDTISITVTPVVDIATDSVTTNEDTLVNITVLGNDSFENAGRTITAINGTTVVVGTPLAVANGTVTLLANGTLNFTPAANYNGPVSFTYTVTSGGVTETATVNVTVSAVDDAPVNTVPGVQSTTEDTARVFSLANGNAITVAEVDGGTLTTTISIANGTLTLGSTAGVTVGGNGTGNVTITGPAAAINAALNGTSYTPTADYNGSATLTVVTNDGTLTDTDTIGITVTPVVDIANDGAATSANTAVNIDVNANDAFENVGHQITAINGTAISVGGSVAVTNGSVRLNANGTLDFTPTAGFGGAASFTYTVTSGGVTETATVNLTVSAVLTADAPTINENAGLATDSAASGHLAADPVAAGNVLSNDAGAISVTAIRAGAGSDVTVVAGGTTVVGTYGTLVIQSDGNFTYTPDNDNAAVQGLQTIANTLTDGFTYTAGGQTAVLNVTITGVNDAPVLTSIVISDASVGNTAFLTDTMELTTASGSLTGNSGAANESTISFSHVDLGPAGNIVLGTNSNSGSSSNYWTSGGISSGQHAVGESTTFNVAFNNGTVQTVNRVSFTINDIDAASGTYRDNVIITALDADGNALPSTVFNFSVGAAGFAQGNAITNGLSLSGTAYSSDYLDPTYINITSATGISSLSIQVLTDGVLKNGTVYISPISFSSTQQQTDTLADWMAGKTSDVDAGSTVKGYAIVSSAAEAGDPTPGKWRYSTDGGTTWVDMPATSTSAALFLTPNTLVCWSDDDDGHPPLSVVAVDNTSTAINGAILDVTVRGGSTPYSTGIATLAATVATDTLAPSPSILLSDYLLDTGGTPESALVTITFNEPVTGLTASDFNLSSFTAGTTLNSLATIDGGKTWTATLSGLPSSTMDASNAITVAAGSYTDLAGNDGLAGSSANVEVTFANTAPVNTITNLSTNEDTALKLSGLSIADNAVGSGNITVTLSVASGTIAAAASGGVTVAGSGTGTITLDGTLANLNAYLGTVATQPTYTPAANASGNVQLTMTTNDNGNSGSGGALTDVDSATITVIAFADTPTLLPAPTRWQVYTDDWQDVDPAVGSMTWTSPTGLEARYGMDNYNLLANPHTPLPVNQNIVMEIEAGPTTGASSVSSTVNFGTAGQVVEISFDTIARNLLWGHGAPDVNIQGFSVLWNGVNVGAFNPTTAAWVTANIQVTSLAGDNVLTFVSTDTGSNHQIGDVIDNVRVGTIGDTTINGTSRLPSLAGLATFGDITDNSESHTLTLSAIPVGAVLTDGTRSFTATAGNTTATLFNEDNPSASTGGSNWSLANLSLTAPTDFVGQVAMQFSATSVEASNGSTSTISETVVATIVPLASRLSVGTLGDDTLNQSAATAAVRLVGQDGNDTLTGGSGNDWLEGGIGNDTMNGGAGNDLLIGGSGNDRMTGGAGADVFAWSLADRGAPGAPAVDTITDFDLSSTGDRLNLRDLLVGENTTGGGTGNLASYLDFDTASTPGSTVVRISSTGGFSGGSYAAGAEDQRIVLEGLDVRSALGLGAGASDDQILQELLLRNKLDVGP